MIVDGTSMAGKSLSFFCLLFVLFIPGNVNALSLSPSAINDSEGSSISIDINIQSGDWIVPDSQGLEDCESVGTSDATFWITFMIEQVDLSASWGSGPSSGDLYLSNGGSPVPSGQWFLVCITNPSPPNGTISGFSINLNHDEIEEPEESAVADLYTRSYDAILYEDSIEITIEAEEVGPSSDWVVTVTDVSPTSVLPEEPLSITAVGERITTPGYIYSGGWSVAFLLSTNDQISLNDEVLETRSFLDFSFGFEETWSGSLDVAPGEYWVGACSTISDDNPANDCSSATRVIVKSNRPDLKISDVDADSTFIVAGDSLEISAKASNIGDVFAEASTASFLLSSNSSITASDLLLTTAPVSGLAAGQRQVLAETVVIDVAAGDYYLGVCVDEIAGEINGSNNCAAGPLIEVESDPDSLCSTEPIACGAIGSGELDTSDCTTGPRGLGHYAQAYTYNGAAGDTLFLDAGWFGGLDGYLLLEGPNGLVVAQNDNHTSAANSRIEYVLPQSGTYTVWATSYLEGDMGSFEVSLSCENPSGPDLGVEFVSIGSGSLLPGQQIMATARLWNTGDRQSDSSDLRFVLSSNPQIDLKDTELGLKGAPGLDSGASADEQISLIAPSTPGTWWLGACVDSVNGEANEANNCSPPTRFQVEESSACFSSGLSCGAATSSNLNNQDCSRGPRGAGYFAEERVIFLNSGEPVAIRSEWDGMDGVLYLLDPDGRTVAQNDDNLDTNAPQSVIEYTPMQSGNYSIWMTSFGRNETGGFSLSADCGKSSAPDLVATSSLVSDPDVNVGDSVLISYTITNQGNATADGTTILMCLSTDPVISLRDNLLDTDEIGPLGAGQSITLEMEVNVPNQPGDYWVGPCAKAVEGEAATGNNCTVPPPGQQFVESDSNGRSFPNALNDGGLLLNVSSGAACNSQPLTCGQSQSGSLQSSDCDRGPRGTGYVSDVYTLNGNAGDTVELIAQWQGVDGYLYLEDPSGEIYDENDDFQDKNGSRIEVMLDQSGSYTVWPTAFGQGDGGSYQLSLDCNNPKAPDLDVDKPELSSNSLRPGQSLQIRTRARNKGGFKSGSSAVDFLLANNPQLDDEVRVLKSNDVPSLDGGDSSEESTMVQLNVVPGSYYIGSCVKADAGELDTGNNCKSSGPITIEQTPDPIPINSGLNDAWFDPATNGQGFFINVFPDTNLMFLSWFTFDTERPPASVPFELGDPGHRWLTAQGVYDQGVAKLDVFLTAGGVFDSSNPPASSPVPYGTMDVSFSDCNQGLIEFDLPEAGEAGAIAVTRVVDENVAACEEQLGGLVDTDTEIDDPNAPFTYNRSLNDAWYNPATNGQGFFFNVYPELEYVFLSWFTYDVQRPPPGTPFNLGEPGHRWQTAQGNFNGDTANLVVNNTSGGVFNEGGLPPGSTVNVGSIVATFDNCNSGVVSYSIDSIGRQGQVPIERIARDGVPACEEDSKSDDGGSPEGIVPAEKDRLENFCNGSVDWKFDWPDVEGAGYYLFELYRNDSLAGSPRASTTSRVSEFEYSGKEPLIATEHVNNWRWRYRPILNFGKKRRTAWSEFYEFNVRSPDNPCAN